MTMQATGSFSERAGPRWWPWPAALLYVVLLLALGQPAYLISDDVGILRNLENGFEAPFISMLFGKMLLALYRLAPAVPWYGLSLVLAHGASLGLFLSALAAPPVPRGWKRAAGVLYLSFYSGFLLRVSFNAASMMLGINALLAWCSRRGAPPSRAAAAALGCALAGSYLVRVDGFYLVALLAAPVGWRCLFSRRVLFFLAPLFLALALNTLAAPRFMPAAYREYAGYNLARGRFMDFPVAQANTNNATLLAAMNWSSNDYRVLTHWFFLDEEVFTRARFEEIVARTDLARRTPPGYTADGLRVFWTRYRRHLLVLGLALLAACRLSDRRSGALAYSAYALAIMVGVALVYRFPPRVGTPSFLAAAATVVFLAAGAAPRPARRFERVLGWAAVLVAAAPWLAEAAAWSRQNRADRAVLDETAAILREYPSATLFVTEPAIALRLEAMPPFRARRTYPENILPAGWATFSPLFYAVLGRHGLARGADVLPRAVDNPEILFILFNENFGDIIATWLREHAGREARVENIRALPAGRGLYRLVSAERGGESG